MNLDSDLRDERDGPGHAQKDRERERECERTQISLNLQSLPRRNDDE